ncbi:MAG: non-hydrolyzing UDP-N-acetylglucosamine 2-epimerase [Aureliella sp.]
MKKKIGVVAGTRPECIKMAPVYFELQRSETLVPVFLATAQHRQMLDQTLSVFGIRPEHDLDLMQPGQTLADLTARVIQSVSQWCQREQPAALLVQGDTTTVLASAIAAFYHGVPVGHVEAGLRTGNMQSPFPEEMNRRLTSPLAKWHFCPTDLSRDNLLAESIDGSQVFVTGNTVVDALLWVRDQLTSRGVTRDSVIRSTGMPAEFVDRFLVSEGGRWILVTGHRRESFGGGFERICQAIAELARRYPDVGILYPVHLNPNVREPVNRLLGSNPAIALIEPVDYLQFVWLMDHCTFLLSDSGGVQEEAPSLGKPVLVMRDTTERPEGVAAGTCRLVGTEPQRILEEAALLLDDPAEYRRRSSLANPYGDGQASQRIRQVLEASLS